MDFHGETWKNVVSCTLSAEELDSDFYGSRGKDFTLWTKGRVYFPAKYDNEIWVESVSRNPDGKSTESVGGS